MPDVPVTDENRGRPSVAAAAATVAVFGGVMSYSIVALDAPPHIPMLAGCFVSGLAALLTGSRWQDVERGMVRGISQSLVALIILLLIGVLIGVWIGSGVVPALVLHGLSIMQPRYFLVSAMLICSIISMAVGSWGTAGTIGLALMGIARAMGIPPAMAAGAIISGAYLGDKASPLSDSTNLASAVTEVDVFTNVRHMFPVAAVVFLIAGALYTVLGLGYAPETVDAEGVSKLIANIERSFGGGLVNFLPMTVLVVCILAKVPSIPSVAMGIVSAAFLGFFVHGLGAGELFEYAWSGYVSASGDEMTDALLSAGGIESMMFSISLIICAMMFGGIMEESGLMAALMSPLFRTIHKRESATDAERPKIVGVTVASCILVNLILPEQFIAISLPGRMFAAEYDRRGIPRKDLTRALGAGGAAASPLIPWNTCGVFMTGVLGVSTYAYAPWAFLNLMIPFAVVLSAFVKPKRRGRGN